MEEKKEEFDTDYQFEMICPHCGKDQSNPWEYSDMSDTVECGWCEKEFHYEKFEPRTRYTTSKMADYK